MKDAKNEIIQTDRANKLKYYLSIAEKENESGLMFNQRLFFLLSGQHIGYLSAFKMDQKPEAIDFQKAKSTKLLNSIRNVSYQQKEVHVKYNQVQSNKNVQKKWIFRFSTEQLAKLWYSLIQAEKVASTQKKPDPQPKNQQIKPKPEIIAGEKSKKNFEIVSKNLQVKQILATQKETKEMTAKETKEITIKETKEMATSVSPKNSNSQLRSNKKRDSEQQLAKILNQDASKVNHKENSDRIKESQHEKQGGSINNDETERSQKKSLFSQPPHKRTQNLIKKYVEPTEDSKNDSFKQSARQISENSGASFKRQEEYSKNEEQYLPKINILPQITNKKYYDSRENSELENNSFKKTENSIKKSPIDEQLYTQKLDVSNELKKYSFQRSVQSSGTSRNKTHRFEFPLIKDLNSSLPWTFKYTKYNHLIFEQFKLYSQKLLKQLIQDLSLPIQARKYKAKLVKNNLICYQIDDVQVKLALIGLDTPSQSENIHQTESVRVCSKEAIRLLRKEFNNFKALYEYLGDSQKLRVPLVSLCQHHGFLGFFKILSKNTNKMVKQKDLKQQLDRLNIRSKIEIDISDSINTVVIMLDQSYYNNFKRQEDQLLDFRIYFIQQINQYLFPDLITDQVNNKHLVLRKQIIQTFDTELVAIRNQQNFQPHQWRSQKINRDQLINLSKELLREISQSILQLQSLRVYFMNSRELNKYFHSKGINIRYLGHIYSHLKVNFQKRIFMTEMAARSCKSLLKKTLQDLSLDSRLQGEADLQNKLCDFFNCVFGNNFETAELWKVLSSHSEAYFGVSLNLHQIDRWFFVISIVQNCRLNVNWNKISIEQTFKSNQFFNQQNLKGMNSHSKTYPPLFSEQFGLISAIISSQQNFEGFQKLVKILSLKNESIPDYLKDIQSEIKRYLAHFISPRQYENQYNHLKLFEKSDCNPSKVYFEILLIQIKWNLKLKEKEAYIKNCDLFLREVTRFYGQFHPIFTNLYDLFSAYHLSNGQFEDAITFAKSSLVNQLKICGTNHQKTSQCYYHLALCYIKANKRQEAISHIKKSQQYFQVNEKKETIAYAIMCLKLSLLYLNQNMIDISLQTVQKAYYILQLFQAQKSIQYQDQLTQCFQIMARCFQIVKDKRQLKQLSSKCKEKLKSLTDHKNFQKIIKIYLFSIFSQLNSSIASSYIDLITQVSPFIIDNQQMIGYELLKARLVEESFFSSLLMYLQNINSIELYLKENQILKNWVLFNEQYPRQTVKDFVSLTTQLLAFLGEGFVVGALRQAL